MTTAYESLKRQALQYIGLLETKPRIRVGSAMCGQAVGANALVKAFKEELETQGIDGIVTEVGCLGICYAEPLVDIQIPHTSRMFYGNVTLDQVPTLVHSSLISRDHTVHPPMAMLGDESWPGIPHLGSLEMMAGQVRIALRNAGHIDPLSLHEYIATGGYAGLDKALSGMTPQEVTEEVITSGLRGRGGAAFQTGRKWQFLMDSTEPIKYILCNCEEGDPGAFNDKGILESDPHTLVEGMILAGYATGASNGVVFIRHGHDGPIDRTNAAIRQGYESGLLGSNILGSHFSFDAEVSLVGESYVSGEETALMESIEGKRAMPRYRPPFPAAVGVWGKPSNINNVKTLAYVPEIISNGGAWFANIGTEGSKGTAILCLSGNVLRPGMIEVPMGMTLRKAIEELGGGVRGGRQLKLLQTGGPLGGVLSADMIDIPLDFDAMAKAGAILGSGGIIVADESACAVDLTRLLVAFCQYESCGKCFPCRLGTTHLLEILERICSFESRSGDMQMMRSVGTNMAAGSLCGHGQLGFNPVQSALTCFADEFTAHMDDKQCPANVCSGVFLTPQRSRR
ncbi:SLBB domain-containing protein [Dehalococcoidia bacterium]|nr:SLBB domain-containing protein [Dehalococcoidia bacterium]